MESGPQCLRTPSREFSDEIGKVSLTLSIDIDSRTAMTCESINSQLPLPIGLAPRKRTEIYKR